jgi:hypothetical protein
MLRKTLYSGFGTEDFGQDISGLPEHIVRQNGTIKAIIECCRRSVPGAHGLRSIVTYNYDNLIELGLLQYAEGKNFEPIYKRDQSLNSSKIPYTMCTATFRTSAAT